MDGDRIWYAYYTDKVAERARTTEMLQCLVLAVVHAAADYDMYATGKAKPDREDYESSYHYFRDIIDTLGIPAQAIVDTIDDCFPDDPRENLTECASWSAQASTS